MNELYNKQLRSKESYYVITDKKKSLKNLLASGSPPFLEL